jgi:hypothetical protein
VLVIEIRGEEEQAVSEGSDKDFHIIRRLRNILRTEDREYFGTVLHFLLLKAYIWRIYALDRCLCCIDVIYIFIHPLQQNSLPGSRPARSLANEDQLFTGGMQNQLPERTGQEDVDGVAWEFARSSLA